MTLLQLMKAELARYRKRVAALETAVLALDGAEEAPAEMPRQRGPKPVKRAARKPRKVAVATGTSRCPRRRSSRACTRPRWRS